MAQEVMAQRVGNATMLARLADVIIIRLIRRWAETRGDETLGWLAAVRDPRIGKALIAMHQWPEKSWSVESLARVASLSRSMFSDRFASVLGMPPAKYLATWRMSLARHLLSRERLSVAQVAARLGYDSSLRLAGHSREWSAYPQARSGVRMSCVLTSWPKGNSEPFSSRRVALARQHLLNIPRS